MALIILARNDWGTKIIDERCFREWQEVEFITSMAR